MKQFAASLAFCLALHLLAMSAPLAFAETRPDQPDGPPHYDELVQLVRPDETKSDLSRAYPEILIVTSGSGPLTGISPIAEKDYFEGLLQSLNYSVDWLDITSGSLNYSHLDPYDLVIYDAGGYWYPFYQNTTPLLQYHNSGRPLLLVAPDVNYDWANIGNFGQECLHIPGALGILPAASFDVIADSGHPIIESIPTNQQIPVVNGSSYPDCFDPGSESFGVLTQGFISATEFGTGSVAGAPTSSPYDPQGELFGVVAYPGSASDGRVVLFGWPVTAIQQGDVLDELCLSSVQWLLEAPELGCTLVVEDADDGITVWKAAGDLVDFVVRVENTTNETLSDIVCRMDLPQGVLGDPLLVYTRISQSQGDGTEIGYSAIGDGDFEAVMPDLSAGETLQVGWRFRMPQPAPSVCYDLAAEIMVGGQLAGQDDAMVSVADQVQGIMITNRRLLYDRFGTNAASRAQVDALLARLYEISDANQAGEISNVIYYLDRENDTIRDWDHFGVDYGQPADLNEVAEEIQGIIQSICNDRLADEPDFLTIIGGDEVIPLFRASDDDFVSALDEWAVGPEEDSPTFSDDPLLAAFDNNYFVCDAFYGDLSGNDWHNGDYELAIGRIVGASASDMQRLVDRGTAGLSAAESNAVVASRSEFDTDSWVEGLVAVGFDVKNDTESPSTIENDNWSSGTFVNLLNQGFSVVGTYGHAARTTFASDGIDSRVWNSDIPDMGTSGGLFIDGGCRAGVPTNNGTTWTPAYLDNHAWTFSHQGAAGFVGSGGTTIMIISNNVMVVDERFMGLLFRDHLLPVGGDESRPVGLALRNNSRSFIWFGPRDRKAAVQHILYGLPWVSIPYPDNSQFMLASCGGPSPGLVEPTKKLADNTYAVTVVFAPEGYNIVQEQGYELLEVVGASQFGQGLKPVLPYFEHTITLPLDAEIAGIFLSSENPVPLGPLDIPSPAGCSYPPCGDAYGSSFDVSGVFPVDRLTTDLTIEDEYSLLKLHLMAATHNVDTKETILYDATTVRIEFQSDAPLIIQDFELDGYWEGDTPHLKGEVDIQNLSPNSIVDLTARFEVFDDLGNVLGVVEDEGLIVGPGLPTNVVLDFAASAEQQRYRCRVVLLDPAANILGEVSDYVWLSPGELLDFDCESEVLQGEDITFQTQFRNNGATAIDALALVRIYTETGTQLAVLPGEVTPVAGASVVPLTVQWNTAGKPLGNYTAQVLVQAEGLEYGPRQKAFAITAGQELRVEAAGIEVVAGDGSSNMAVRVHNDGTLPVTAAKLRLEFAFEGGSVQPIGEDLIFDVAAADSMTLTTVWDHAGLLGHVTVHATVDPENEIAEVNEDDNHAAVSVQLTGELECAWNEAIGLPGNTARSFGGSWGDFDGDGDPDFFVANDGANQLYENLNGTLVLDSRCPEGEDVSRGVAWADVDNDGDLDLYIVNWGQANRLYRNDNGQFVDITAGPEGDDGDGYNAAFADIDGDGDLDLYLTKTAGTSHLMRNDGGQFVIVPGDTEIDGVTRGCAFADFDNDGDQDLYVSREGANKLLVNDGAGNFSDQTPLLLANMGSGKGVAWGDYDNDGWLDLFLVNQWGNNHLYHNEQGQGFTETESAALSLTETGRSAVWCDFDNDGWLDLFVTNVQGANRLVRNVAGEFSEELCGSLAEFAEIPGWGCSPADVDGDGDQDLIVANINEDEPCLLFLNDLYSGLTSQWLAVELVGVLSNSHGVGARIEVDAGAERYCREVSSGSSYLSQSPHTVGFGLGTWTRVDVTVKWPSGLVQGIKNVNVGRRLVVTEGSAASAVPTEEIPRVFSVGNYPNPFNPMTTIAFGLPEAAEVTLEIYDLRGGSVRSVCSGQRMSAGHHAVVWNGQDDSGQTVSSGVYFYRLQAGRNQAVRRMTLIK